jgi:hypothetical protein
VKIAWPNGSISHFGNFSSERTAIGWISDHRWMTTNIITDPRLLRRGGRYKRADCGKPCTVRSPFAAAPSSIPSRVRGTSRVMHSTPSGTSFAAAAFFL